MPPDELWLQYSVVGILVLATALIAVAFYRLWRELLSWIEKQDEKRDTERNKQREWEASQSAERNAEWQHFISQMQERCAAQDNRNSKILEQLTQKIELLTVAVNNHDTYARAIGSERK